MPGWGKTLILFAAGFAFLALAQGTESVDGQRRLAEQKLRLLEILVSSPLPEQAAKRGNETEELFSRGRSLFEEARRAIGAGRYDEAVPLLDEALRSLTRAHKGGAGGLAESALRQRHREMAEQVATYREALLDLSRDPRLGSAAHTAVQRVDALSAESERLAAAGRLGEANRKLAEAYRLAVEELSRLRAGQEVVLSLRFSSPEEEYPYELKRYQSNGMLVEMMIGEGRAEGEKRRLVDDLVREAERLKGEAMLMAQTKRYQDAVATMEKAYAALNRALQAMGMPVF